MGIQELIRQLVLVIEGASRFRWGGLMFAWIMFIGGWLVVISLPNRYESSARVYVDTDSVLRPLLRDLTPDTNVRADVAIMSLALRTRPQLEEVAQLTDLYLRAKDDSEMESLIDDMRDKIRLTAGSEGMYNIHFTDNDPEMAQRVVQALVDSFMEKSLGANRADAEGAGKFLEQEVDDYARRLTIAEQKLADFKKENFGLLPGDGGDYFTRLRKEREKLDTLESEYRLAETRRSTLIAQLQGEQPTFGLSGSTQTEGRPEDGDIAKYQQQLDDLLLQYTPEHPTVKALQEKIDQIKADVAVQVEEERANPLPSFGGSSDTVALNSLNINPVYQSMKISLSETELKIAELRGQLAEQRTAVRRLDGMIGKLPDIEAALQALTRDYDVTRVKYNDLLGRLEQARLGERVDEQNTDARFQLLEPPIVPLHATGPPRLLFMCVVFFAALAAGGALAIFLDQTRPVFLTRQSLRDEVGIPILGAISRVQTPQSQSRERRSRWRFAGATASLAGLFALSLVSMGQAAGLLEWAARDGFRGLL